MVVLVEFICHKKSFGFWCHIGVFGFVLLLIEMFFVDNSLNFSEHFYHISNIFLNLFYCFAIELFYLLTETGRWICIVLKPRLLNDKNPCFLPHFVRFLGFLI